MNRISANALGPATAAPIVAALAVAIGIAVGGWLIGRGFAESRAAERFVTVKGVAERDVTADLALWPIRYTATGNDLAAVQRTIAEDGRHVRAFLEAGGLPATAMAVQGLQVVDLLAQTYRSGPVDSRFIVAETLIVRTADVARIAALGSQLGDVVAAGVVLAGADGGPIQGPAYLFTRLNDVKPGMIEEATKSARQAAEQFARDSGSHVAGLRRASQGLFQILPRDDVPGASEQSQIHKVVRVVSTIDYALAD